MPETNPEQVGPPPSSGFGSREATDATRQAQQSMANDTPVDVNFNAVVARSQGLTFDVLGKEFAAGAARRNAIFDQMAAKAGG